MTAILVGCMSTPGRGVLVAWRRRLALPGGTPVVTMFSNPRATAASARFCSVFKGWTGNINARRGLFSSDIWDGQAKADVSARSFPMPSR
ncbi:hypothetical protein [Azorhizobium caulinodans]|uniref:hypothetical protein n=1 Tax=Azorhizobium caulinodans TaxID=7 RepID=UPI002FBEBAB9